METEYIREATVRYVGPKRRASAMRAPADVWRFLKPIIGRDARESFVVIHLDGRHRPIGWERVSTGTATASLVHPREVYQAAIIAGACAIITAHNHPSGDATPSQEDRDIHERLTGAGKLLGIPMLDSVVVTDRGYCSLREGGASWLS